MTRVFKGRTTGIGAVVTLIATLIIGTAVADSKKQSTQHPSSASGVKVDKDSRDERRDNSPLKQNKKWKKDPDFGIIFIPLGG